MVRFMPSAIARIAPWRANVNATGPSAIMASSERSAVPIGTYWNNRWNTVRLQARHTHPARFDLGRRRGELFLR